MKVVESFRRDNEHLIFNSLFLEMISKIGKTKFYSDFNYWKEISSQIENQNIEYEHILVKKNNCKKNILINYFLSAYYSVKILFSTEKKEKIFYTSVNFLNLFFIKFFNCFLKRNVYCICHGELETLLEKNDINLPILYKMIAPLYRIIFKFKNNSVKYIVLGESIKKNLNKIIPSLKVIVIDHPYIYPKITEKLNVKKDILTFGVVGVYSNRKGSNNILKLAEKYFNKSEFVIIGKIKDKIETKFKNKIKIPFASDDFISKDLFNKEIEKLDYILYFYDENSYKLTASGALFDAISHNKPIIYLKNDFFNYYLDKYEGIGTGFDNYSDLENYISLVINKDIKYDSIKFNKNIKKLKKDLSSNSILKNLKKEIEKRD
ncbi:MAG: hypothetical protein ACRCZ2_08810 [Fusobacteriaceae bacterium]